MSNPGRSVPPQGGGELSGLLRSAEALQQELDKALAALEGEVVVGQDPRRHAVVELTGSGGVKSVHLELSSLSEAHRKAIEESIATALRGALERLFELRKQRATTVTRGMTVPGLFL
jgi:DNA-binding protein YbaB